jgi:hypothetical protein
LSKFGLEALLVGVYTARYNNGETQEALINEINGLFISDDLKRKLKEELSC